VIRAIGMAQQVRIARLTRDWNYTEPQWIQVSARRAADTKRNFVYETMQEAGNGPFPPHVNRVLLCDTGKAECICEAPAELPREGIKVVS
jgi:hypothetical protein